MYKWILHIGKKIKKLYFRITNNNYVNQKKLPIVKQYAKEHFDLILGGTLSSYNLEECIVCKGKYNSISLDKYKFYELIFQWYEDEYKKFDQIYQTNHKCNLQLAPLELFKAVYDGVVKKKPIRLMIIGSKNIQPIFFNIKRRLKVSKAKKNSQTEFEKLENHYTNELNNHVFKDYETYIDDIYHYLTEFCTKTHEYFKNINR